MNERLQPPASSTGPIRAAAEALARELGVTGFGRAIVELEFERGSLGRTFIKLGPIKNSELEHVAQREQL